MALLAWIAAQNPIALWGAILSTILAVLKIYEVWDTRTKIEVSYSICLDSAIGNEIIIRNLSDKPIIITYWELLWQHREWGRIVTESGIFADNVIVDKRLEGHTSMTISLAGDRHFSATSRNSLDKNKIYLYLYLAGYSRPIRKKYYDPRKRV